MIRLACERLTRNLTREEWRQYLVDEPYRATCPNFPESLADNDKNLTQRHKGAKFFGSLGFRMARP
jgi:hypothetical protein